MFCSEYFQVAIKLNVEETQFKTHINSLRGFTVNAITDLEPRAGVCDPRQTPPSARDRGEHTCPERWGRDSTSSDVF